MVKIRLKQMGKKGQKTYRVVVTESTTWRDGKTIEELGYYNPQTNPSTININVEKYNSWIANGAQPSPAMKNIFKNSQEQK